MRRLVAVVLCVAAVVVGGVAVASAQSRDPFRPPPGLSDGPSAPGAPAPAGPVPARPDRAPAVDDLPRTGQDLASPASLAVFFIVSGLALRVAAAPFGMPRRRLVAG